MTFPSYPKTRNERAWIVPELAGFNVLAQLDPQGIGQEVIPLEGISIPQASPAYTPSLERNPTAGVRALIKRKITPAEWSLPFYAKTAQVAGDYPSYHELLKRGLGVETDSTHATLTTALAGTNNDLVYTARAGGTGGNSVQIEYLVAGNNTPLSVTATTTKVTVNVATDGGGAATSTASQVRTAVRASLAAMALLRSVENASANDGTGVVTALVATNLTGGTGTAQVTYTFATDVDTLSFTLWHFTDNLMRAIRGSVVGQASLEGSGSDEPKWTFTGLSSYGIFAGVSKNSGSHNNSVTTIQLVAGGARRFSLGIAPVATDFLYLQWESEIVKWTAVDYTLDQLTVVRGQLGSTAATHADQTEIGPWVPARSADPADIISPIVLGDITLDGVSTIGVNFAVVINNNLEARLDEYAVPGATGYRRSAQRTITGHVRGYMHQGLSGYRAFQDLLSNLDREKAENVVIVCGSTATARMRVLIPVTRFLEPPDVDGGGPEFQFEFPFQALEVAGNDELSIVFDS